MYTFKPEQKFAKAHGTNLRISAKASTVLCRVIRKKTLKRSRRLLENLLEQKQSLDGKYYTKACRKMLELLNSCEKNAEFLGLDVNRLMVYASASKGPGFRRRRRKAGFGSTMKMTNVEIILIEKGKESKTRIPKKMTKKDGTSDAVAVEIKKAIDQLKEKQHSTEAKVHEAEEKIEHSHEKHDKEHKEKVAQ